MSADLISLRKQAEQAVADMQPGEIRTKAFEVILNHLLAGHNGKSIPKPKDAPRTRLHSPKASVRGGTNSRPARIMALATEGFFDQQRTLSDIKDELSARGWHYGLNALSTPVQKLVQQQRLRRVKVSNGNKKVWKYSNP